jgi:hypothetical protein
MMDPIPAAYDGRCGICQGPIVADVDWIVSVDGEWCHDTCVEDE